MLQELVDRELKAASEAEVEGDFPRAWLHFERAHVAAQPLAGRHTTVHWRMGRFAWRRRQPAEVAAQIVLVAVAAFASITGLYAAGNAGRALGTEIKTHGVPEDILRAVARR